MISVEGGGGVGQLGEKKGRLEALIAGLAVLLIPVERERELTEEYGTLHIPDSWKG